MRRALILKRKLLMRRRCHPETIGSTPTTMPLLLLSGDRTHDNEMTADERAQAVAMLDELLAAASANGFTRTDTLRTLLARGDRSAHAVALAHEAMTFISVEEIGAMLKHTYRPVAEGNGPGSETT
ncbi:hypothetical protein R75461_07420 [Paraburkholderia nemoris]|nr:hypothetical protein [Paraburkholderia aspalathi]MBK3786261.1 hypothetical protein [Paraburkholderia aspalathi]CAE6849970.1 hypothetical protein R75461_07420 [Paraburkholderia nemoris]